MKRFSLITLILSASIASAQYSKSPEDTSSNETPRIPAWQVGIVFTDIVVPAISIEASLQMQGRHHLGIKISRPYYSSFNESDLYNTTNWAFKGGVHHKIFFSPNNIDKLTFRHGLRAGISDLSFSASAWVPYEQYGTTRLEYRDVNFSERPISLGYEVLLGWQTNYGAFYSEMYLGLSYETLINSADLLALDYKGDYYSLDYFGPGYEYDSGIRPVIGLIIGLTDPF